MPDNISILIIEDEVLIAHNIKLLLEDFGYTIANVCYKYETAIQAIEKCDFDVVISDINLGKGIDEKSGITLIEHLKKIKECPFIFLTAFGDIETVKKASVHFPSAYLVKPVNGANLFAAVQLAVTNFELAKPASLDTNNAPDYFYTKQGNKLVKIFWKDIYYLEAVKNYVRIKTVDQHSTVMLRGSLQQVLVNTMPATYKKLFIRISRSTAIAKNIIETINTDSVVTTYGSFECTINLKEEDL